MLKILRAWYCCMQAQGGFNISARVRQLSDAPQRYPQYALPDWGTIASGDLSSHIYTVAPANIIFHPSRKSYYEA